MSIRSAIRLSRVPGTAFMIIGLYWGTFAAHVPDLKAQLGVNDATFGMLLVGQAVGLLSAMVLAPLLDRSLGQYAMPLVAAVMALLWFLPAGATVPLFFMISMALLGMGSGILDVIMNARVSELESLHNRSLMNANHGLFSLAYAAAAVLSGITREAGLPMTVPVTILAVLVGILCFFLRMKPRSITAEEIATSGRYPLWPVVLCGLIVFAAFMSEATVEVWSALHVERTLNGGAAEGALGPAMLGIMMAVGRFSGQAVTERLREPTVLRAASALAAVGALIAAAAPNPLVAYLGFGVFGLGVSVIGPIGLAIVGRLVAPRWRTVAISQAAVMGFSGFFVAPLFMGLISEAFGLRVAFASVAGILLMPWVLILLIARLPERAPAPEVRT